MRVLMRVQRFVNEMDFILRVPSMQLDKSHARRVVNWLKLR